MDKCLVGTDIVSPGNHASFQQIFESQLGDLMKNIIVERRKICDYDGNEDLPTLDWHGGAIELLVVDCGRSLAVNDAWWTILSSRFVPDKTLIIMQDRYNHARVPEIYWENTKIFTHGKGQQLDLIHEVKNAGIATFHYRGASNAKQTRIDRATNKDRSCAATIYPMLDKLFGAFDRLPTVNTSALKSALIQVWCLGVWPVGSRKASADHLVTMYARSKALLAHPVVDHSDARLRLGPTGYGSIDMISANLCCQHNRSSPSRSCLPMTIIGFPQC